MCGPLSYDAAHHRWEGYCADAGAGIGIHQLRHSHATELIDSGVSIEAVRRRLGHASTETTQVYALLADKVADAEIRAARRRRDRPSRLQEEKTMSQDRAPRSASERLGAMLDQTLRTFNAGSAVIGALGQPWGGTR